MSKGTADLSDAWTGFTQFTILDEKPPEGCSWSGGGWQKSKQHPGQITCGQKYGKICQTQLNEKNKNGLSKNRSSTMRKSWEGLTSFIRQMHNSKKPSQNALKKLEVTMPAVVPCKIRRSKHGETCSPSGTRKTKYACIVEADESARKRFEGTLHKDHEDHIAGKGINSLNQYNLVH